MSEKLGVVNKGRAQFIDNLREYFKNNILSDEIPINFIEIIKYQTLKL